MNILVYYAHPFEGSFCKGILDRVVIHLTNKNSNFIVKDLVKMNFDPIMRTRDLKATVTKEYSNDVSAEQQDILWADVLITINPVWFGTMPGFMKGYFDKVFIGGFAYDKTGGLLQNKRIFSLFTFGATDPYIDLANQYRMIDYQWDNLFGMTGFKDIAKMFFRGVPRATDEQRQKYLAATDQFIDLIFDTKLGDIGPAGHGELLTKLSAGGYLNGKV